MPVIALILAFAELRVLSWLVVEVEEPVAPSLRVRGGSRPSA
jgi:hypothetical protein